MPKVQAFARAGQEAKSLLDGGCSREALRERVSPAGRRTLWEGWCGYLGLCSPRGGRPAAGSGHWGMRGAAG